jgi:hypothetical protein
VEAISFRLIGGDPMLPGMLCWVKPPKKAKPKPPIEMAQIVAIMPETDDAKDRVSISVRYTDGRTEEIPAGRIEMLYSSTPPYDVPMEFAREASLRVGEVVFGVGHQVYFPNEAAARALTGHTAMECLGYIAMVEDDQLIIGFSAIQTDKSNKRFLLRVEPKEIVIVAERITIGTMLVTLGVEGMSSVNIYNPRWQELSKSPSNGIKK